MRRVIPADHVGECPWMGCTNDITHDIVNVAGETESVGCEFHAHQYRKYAEALAASKAAHPST